MNKAELNGLTEGFVSDHDYRFEEFRTRLNSKFQCTLESLDGIQYLERNIDGTPIQCVVDLGDDEIMLPSVIRSICRRLKIDPRELDIGFQL